MAIRMGRWDCTSCGHLKNMGNATHCVNCGAPRDPNVQFYLLSDEEEIKDKAKIAEARAGADWQCEYCSSENKALNTFCQSCGNSKDGIEKARQEKIIYTPPIIKERYVEPNIDDLPTPIEERKPISYWKWLIVLVIAGALYYFFKPQREHATVVGFAWERTIKLERYDWFTEEGWDLPHGTQLISKRQAIHHTNQVINGYRTESRWVEVQTGTKKVKVGTKDLGNGYFEDVYENQPVYSKRKENHEVPIYKDVPVYQMLYTYKIKKWKEVAPLKAEGTDQNPYDPKLKKPDPENWKLGNKERYYWVRFTTKEGKNDMLIVDSIIWRKLKVNDKVIIKTNKAGIHYGIEYEK